MPLLYIVTPYIVICAPENGNLGLQLVLPIHLHRSTPPRHLPCSQSSCRSALLQGTSSSDVGSKNSPPPGTRLRACPFTSGDGNPTILRSLGTLFPVGSVVPPSTDVLRGISTRVYALLAPLRPPPASSSPSTPLKLEMCFSGLWTLM
jgi:hypothetical protein